MLDVYVPVTFGSFLAMFLHASIPPFLRRGFPVLLGDLNDNMPKICRNRSRESPHCDTEGLC